MNSEKYIDILRGMNNCVYHTIRVKVGVFNTDLEF